MELTKQVTPQWRDFTHDGETIGFLLRPLTSVQKVSLLGMADGLLGPTMLQTIKFGVADWRGITDAGVPVPFSEKALERLFEQDSLFPLLLELAMTISKRADLADADAKK